MLEEEKKLKNTQRSKLKLGSKVAPNVTRSPHLYRQVCTCPGLESLGSSQIAHIRGRCVTDRLPTLTSMFLRKPRRKQSIDPRLSMFVNKAKGGALDLCFVYVEAG